MSNKINRKNVKKIQTIMSFTIKSMLFSAAFILTNLNSCASELFQSLHPPSLWLYNLGDPDFTDVIVKRQNDNLTLFCEVRGDSTPRLYVWNYVPFNETGAGRRELPESKRLSPNATWNISNLQLSDSGHYICATTPYSISKFILVQKQGPEHCARGAFWCGKRCVLATYVCDGYNDCVNGEDEAADICPERPCASHEKLNCSSGRCISSLACCPVGSNVRCHTQHSCCSEHALYARHDGYTDEYPPLYEDRHAPDSYGFIQSTIYSVTACALIFMIAVVLLVSAICKMHMKRAALRSYTHAERATRQHYNNIQTHRFPPCYEASRLLEQERTGVISSGSSPIHTAIPQATECTGDALPDFPASSAQCSSTGLSRLSSLFAPRYRQVPTDVELADVRSSSLNSSPIRHGTRSPLHNYRSPTYCDLNSTEFYFTNPETGNIGRDLNYMATPLELYRRRTLRSNAIDRVLDQIERQRPLTLQLGRFQLSIPRFGRRNSIERRPDTPNVAEINIDDLDFVRLNSNETYTLNGRTIRLLGANFENYPIVSESNRPPPYTEAMRYKLYGPPPEYLSRDTLDNDRTPTAADEQARNNIEMPPRYEELPSGASNSDNRTIDNASNIASNIASNNASANTTQPVINNNNNINNTSQNINHEIIDSGHHAGQTQNINNALTENINNNATTNNNKVTQDVNNAENNNNSNVTTNDNNSSIIRSGIGSSQMRETDENTTSDQNVNNNDLNDASQGSNNDVNSSNNLSAIIDKLPAIDSDVNANDTREAVA